MKILATVIALSAAVFLAAQPDEPRIQLNFQEVMIPMRDGARLQTVILSPKSPKGPLPFLIDRTPYGVVDQETVAKGVLPNQRERWENYFNVYQNIRGRFKSEGTFAMGRPPHDPSDPKGIDETTDAWDTVDWLVKSIPNNNGRAGIAEVWIVNLIDQTVEVYREPHFTGYGAKTILRAGDQAAPQAFPGVTVDVTELLMQ